MTWDVLRVDAGPPTFDDPAEARAHLLDRLVAGYLVLGRARFEEIGAGHITARDPERLDCLWIGRWGVPFDQVTRDDLLLVDRDGRVVEGDGDVNPAGFCIHAPIHEARPDVVAACHAHGAYGVIWAAMVKPFLPITQEACAFHDDHGMFMGEQAQVEDLETGGRIAAALAHHKLVILRNHGLLTVGGTVDEAVGWFVMAERVAEAHCKTEAAGGAEPISEEAARQVAKSMGAPDMAWHAFQFLYRRYVDRRNG